MNSMSGLQAEEFLQNFALSLRVRCEQNLGAFSSFIWLFSTFMVTHTVLCLFLLGYLYIIPLFSFVPAFTR